MEDDARSGLTRAALGGALGALSGFLCVETGLPGALSFRSSQVVFVLGCAAAGALVSFTRARKLALAAPALLGALWLVAAFTPLSTRLLPSTERVDADGDGDVAFVFSSDLQPGGDPDTAYMARLFHGVELVARGRAPALAVSEVHPGRRAGDLARSWLDELHLQAEVVDVGLVGNTHDEAVLLAAEAKARGWRRVLGVTSPTHERRSCATLEHEGLVAVASPARETRYDVPALGRADDRIAAFGSILHEIVGDLVYRRRGWIR